MNYRWKRFTTNKEMGYNTLYTTLPPPLQGNCKTHYEIYNSIPLKLFHTTASSYNSFYSIHPFTFILMFFKLPVWIWRGERSFIALSLFIIWFIFYCADTVLLYCSIIFLFCFSFTTPQYNIVLYCTKAGWR